MATWQDIQSLLRPDYLNTVDGLQLLALQSVATLLPGIHPSIFNGAGQEFSQYRSYQPGDDLRRLDWKLYARSDRFYVREAERETHTRVLFLLDASRSMLHQDGPLNKLEYARYLIATLGWLAHQQGDALGLIAISGAQSYQLPLQTGSQAFTHLLYQLLQVTPAGRFPTQVRNLEAPISQRERAIMVALSDMHETTGELTQWLSDLRAPRTELVLFHQIGANERDLHYPGAQTFVDLETGQQLEADPDRLRVAYRERLEARRAELRRTLQEWEAYYQTVFMDESPAAVLEQFLHVRQNAYA